MKKLTVEEIIKILKDNNISISAFAHNDMVVPEDFKCSDEAQNYKNLMNEALNTYQNSKHNSDESIFARDQYYDYLKIYDLLSEKEYFTDYLGLGEIKEVDQYGGEGQGDDWYSVKYFVDHDVYIKTTGFYSSYNGVDFYDGYGEEVKPIQKTITVYE